MQKVILTPLLFHFLFKKHETDFHLFIDILA